mmetsp:Transcript_17111/g.16331  ORF Transcript_17111/g.16331 Transcript_17111/m.16331 type:complete len:190 (+) Transcript_17111:927-1496(+)
MKVNELLQEHFFHRHKFTILQRAQYCSNVDYIVKSFSYFKKKIYQLANSGSFNYNKEVFRFNFHSEQQLIQFKTKCEESIFTELRQKINEFLSILEGLDWCPKIPLNSHHDFIGDLVAFLLSTIVTLDVSNRELARQCSLVTFQHLASRITEVLATSKNIPKINTCGMLNLYFDHKCLTEFAQQSLPDN